MTEPTDGTNTKTDLVDGWFRLKKHGLEPDT